MLLLPSSRCCCCCFSRNCNLVVIAKDVVSIIVAKAVISLFTFDYVFVVVSTLSDVLVFHVVDIFGIIIFVHFQYGLSI